MKEEKEDHANEHSRNTGVAARFPRASSIVAAAIVATDRCAAFLYRIGRQSAP